MLANTTRRSVLAALAGAALAPFPGRAAKKAAAFALIGDRYHNSDYIRIGLTRTIAKELGVTIDFTDETSLLNAETLDGYKTPDHSARRDALAGWLRRRRKHQRRLGGHRAPEAGFRSAAAAGPRPFGVLDEARARQGRAPVRGGGRRRAVPAQYHQRESGRPGFPPRDWAGPTPDIRPSGPSR